MIEAVAAGLLGLLLGSFLNVCIYRLPRDLSVVTPRSQCTACHRTIAWYDNIPVVSYLALQGRCRWCRERFSVLYPVVELTTGAMFFWSVYSRGWNPLGWKLCLFSAIMIELIFTDLADRILPDEFTKGGAAVGLLVAAFTPPASGLSQIFLPQHWPVWVHSVFESALGGGVAAGLMWFTGALYEKVRGREGLGLGDVKMLLTVGVFLGLPGAMLTVLFGSLLGAIIGGLYILLSGRDAKYELPFGSFLGVAALAVGLFGDEFMAWYWRLGAG
jgi:leader peptidase (prepilin peptidase)/N-methyltransferase